MTTEVPDFLKKWIDNLESNTLNSLYILPFRKLKPDQFSMLFDAIANCTSLTTFSASGHSIEKETFPSLYNALTKNYSLLSIDVGNNKLGEIPDDESDNNESLFSVLCRAMGQNKSIQTWNLEYKCIGLRASKIFTEKFLYNNNYLLNVSLSRNQLGDDGCIELCQGFLKSQNKSIKILNLIDNGIGPRGIKEGITKLLKWEIEESSPLDSPLSNHCSIKELDLSLNKIGDEGGVALGEVLKDNVGLRKICLSNTDIGDKTIVSICSSLKKVIVDDTANSAPTHAKLIKMMSQSSIMTDDSLVSTTSTITTLMLNNNNITSNSCHALASLLSLSPRIKKLSLINNNIGDEGIKILTTEGLNNFDNNGKLEILDLSKNNISFEGFKYIIQYIPRVKVITLHHNNINNWDEEFVKSLKFNEQFIGCSSLKELHLTENGVKTADMKLLCEMIKNGFAPELEELVLGANVSLDQEEDWNEWEKSLTELEDLKQKLSITWK